MKVERKVEVKKWTIRRYPLQVESRSTVWTFVRARERLIPGWPGGLPEVLLLYVNLKVPWIDRVSADVYLRACEMMLRGA